MCFLKRKPGGSRHRNLVVTLERLRAINDARRVEGFLHTRSTRDPWRRLSFLVLMHRASFSRTSEVSLRCRSDHRTVSGVSGGDVRRRLDRLEASLLRYLLVNAEDERPSSRSFHVEQQWHRSRRRLRGRRRRRGRRSGGWRGGEEGDEAQESQRLSAVNRMVSTHGPSSPSPPASPTASAP